MSTIDDIEQGKIDTVRIKRSADGSFEISALDQTPEASAAFQSIVKKVIAEAKALRRAVMEHKSARTGDYDMIVVYPAS
jgi:hypothetical protein